MNEQRKEFLSELAARLSDIYAASSPKPSMQTAAKLVRSTLAKFDIVDEVSIITRKLKDGGNISIVKVGNHIIDITSEQSFSETELDHPLFNSFRGRGRDPIDRDKEEGESSPLNVAAVIRAMMSTPKMAKLAGPDEEMVFHMKLKDLRFILKRLGIISSYEDIKSFLSHHMAEDLSADLIVNGVKVVELKTGRTTSNWMQERLTVAELIEELFKKYVKKTQATG
ncbi:hypothetical protein KYLE_93 [Pantoea phage Kyle]|uniref:Uncharacterized protein n=1 Tax=Pantoea phage Kyle TaxID=2589665 RepID=A0A514A8M2_9CAUD|nr:hypothetical protein HWC52_gp093 [Pantoea phage Kyle]QDH49622.1 hypothetical protein KYLE_93 [Pantoea phage Kyle]